MLTHMEVHIPEIETLSLSLLANEIITNAIQIRGITGLEPVKASINTTPFTSVDGEFLSGNRVGKRNIVLTLGFNPDWDVQTIDSLRNDLYSYFSPKNKVIFRFFDTIRPTCEIIGWVESCNPVLFSRDPEMQISIICPYPYFIGVTPIIIEGEVKIGDDVPNGVINVSEATPIDYEGSIPTGIKVTITVTETLPAYLGSLIIAVLNGSTQFIMFEGQVNVAQDIAYSSIPGEKYLRLLPGDEAIEPLNLLPTVMLDGPQWLQLYRGANLFGVAATEEGLIWTLEYYNQYVGL